MSLDQVDQAASWFQAFLRHTSVISILLALIGSWCLTLVVRFPIRKLVHREWQGWIIRTFDVVAAFLIVVFTWPNSWNIAWGIAVGAASPVIYSFIAFMLIAKWPSLKSKLTLRELESEPEVILIESPPPDARTDIKP